MFSAEHLVHRYRRLLQVAVPAFVAADTLRSALVVTQLAQERMKEWEEEQRAELVCTMRETMKRVVTRCQAKDIEFWPTAVSRAAGVPLLLMQSAASDAPLAPGHSSQNSYFGLFDAQSIVGEPVVVNQSVDVGDGAVCLADGGSTAGGHAQTLPHRQSLNTASVPSSTTVVEYITWSDAWEHVMQSLYQAIHLVSWTIIARSNELPLVRAANEYGAWMGRESTTRVDAVRDWCRASFHWPQMKVHRCSALRCAVDWQGFSQPMSGSAGWKGAPLELDLSHL